VTTTLPPGRALRGQLLLSGRLHPRDADPLELAYATRHILTHRNLAADAFRRSPVDVALAELRASLGDWPRAYFGTAALAALAVNTRPDECVRCRANMIARVRRLAPPGFDAATNFLLGEGCERCRRKPSAQATQVRPSAATVDPALLAAAFGGMSAHDIAREYRRDFARYGRQRAAEKWDVPVRPAAPSRRTIVPGFDPIPSFKR
jgi:hypothetical protein